MEAASLYIGMDLGGTTFKALALTAEGTIVGRIQQDTQAARGPQVVVQRMIDALRQLQGETEADTHRLAAVGFGVPGILDLPEGIIRRSPNLPGWEGFNLRTALKQHLNLPIAIENDANAAVVGEMWLGAGRGTRHFIMLTLGTGVGGGVIVEGKIVHGVRGYGGELGHTVVDPNGHPCGCGSQGCLEQYASGTAIARLAEPHYGKVTARDVAEAAQRGEPPALEVYRQVGHYLGIACASFANMLNPECIAIGGGAANAFPLFIDALQASMRQRAFAEVCASVRVVHAQCGNDAGGFGAAYQALHYGSV
jgi:glucokinase